MSTWGRWTFPPQRICHNTRAEAQRKIQDSWLLYRGITVKRNKCWLSLFIALSSPSCDWWLLHVHWAQTQPVTDTAITRLCVDILHMHWVLLCISFQDLSQHETHWMPHAMSVPLTVGCRGCAALFLDGFYFRGSSSRNYSWWQL